MALKSSKTDALILFSGGLDSTTCLYLAARENRNLTALSFDYSQRHQVELESAKKITGLLKIKHIIQKIDSKIFLGSSITDKRLLIPKNSLGKDMIPNTYVPGRNILFLSFGVSVAESYSLKKIYIGVNALDYSGYPDCRPAFISAFQKAINLGTKSGVFEKKPFRIETPLIKLKKKEIILLAKSLNVPFGMTHSCYSPIGKKPCGECDSCLLRKKGFEEAGIIDE